MKQIPKHLYLTLLLSCCFIYAYAQQSSMAALDNIPEDPVTELINEDNQKEIPVLTAVQMREMQKENKKLTILDTRYSEAYDLAHIISSKHMGMTLSLEKIWMLNRQEPIVVYGDDTDHNKSMVQQLKDKGFTNVYYLYGTLGELEIQGIAVEGDVTKSDKTSSKLNRKRD